MDSAERRAAIEGFAEIVLSPLSPYEDLTVEQAAAGTLVHHALGMEAQGSLTKRYYAHGTNGFWIIAFVQADGLLTLHTSEGCYGVYWGHHGCESILHWLARNGLHDLSYYIPEKLSQGQREYDAEETYKRIRQHLLRWNLEFGREYGRVKEGDPLFEKKQRKREELRREWDNFRYATSYGDDALPQEKFGSWYEGTSIDSAYEFAVYRYPRRLTLLIEHAWPQFIAAVRKDIGWQPKSSTPLRGRRPLAWPRLKPASGHVSSTARTSISSGRQAMVASRSLPALRRCARSQRKVGGNDQALRRGAG